MKNQKRILEEYRSSALRAEMLKQELKELERSTWHTSTAGMLKVSGSGQERFCEARSSLQQKLENEIFELTKKREKVLSLTNSLDDDLLKLVLELKYVRGLTYEKIADVIHYSLRQTMRLHNKAISISRIRSCLPAYSWQCWACSSIPPLPVFPTHLVQ